MMMRAKPILILAGLMAELLSCGKSQPENSGFRIEPSYLSLSMGQIYQLQLKADPAGGMLLAWSSSAPEVVSVDPGGLVKALAAEGSANISVVDINSSRSASCQVNVKTIWAERIDAGGASVKMALGETWQLNPVISPPDVSDKSVSYSSSKESVATVSESGLITAEGTGDAVITLRSGDGRCFATVDVHVDKERIGVSGIDFSFKTEVAKDDVQTATVSYSPAEANQLGFTLDCSDWSVAFLEPVDQTSFRIRALKVGDCEITLTSVNNPQVSRTRSFTVHEGEPAVKFSYSQTNYPMLYHEYNYKMHLHLVAGESITALSASVSNLNSRGLSCASSDESVATVSYNPKTSRFTVTGIGTGETKISVRSVSNPEARDELNVKVWPAPDTYLIWDENGYLNGSGKVNSDKPLKIIYGQPRTLRVSFYQHPASSRPAGKVTIPSELASVLSAETSHFSGNGSQVLIVLTAKSGTETVSGDLTISSITSLGRTPFSFKLPVTISAR